jgi:hypothetical protein
MQDMQVIKNVDCLYDQKIIKPVCPMTISQEHRHKTDDFPEEGVFLLCVPAGWETYISREFYELQEGLTTRGWTKLVIGEVDDAVIVALIQRARIVLMWEAYELLERNFEALCIVSTFEEKQIRRIFFCDDVHHFNSHRRQQRLRAFNWADTVLATYPNKLLEWYPEINKQKIKFTPHSAASYFKPATFPSSDRILLSGSRTWPYPFRQFCCARLSNNICDVIDHPGYPGYPGDEANSMQIDPVAMLRVGREHYAALLSSYPAMLVCGSVFHYLVAKVFEGMAAGCLVICERASLSDRLAVLGFIEGEHYIGTDFLHVVEDANEVRDALLRNDPLYKNMIKNASLKVAEQHTTAMRSAQIHHICMEDIDI